MNAPVLTPVLVNQRVTLPSWLALAVTLGAVVVLAALQLDRSYWNDEAWGVDFAMKPTLMQVWRDSIDQQLPGAPGYLALLHVADQVRDGRPWVFRIPTALAGLLMFFSAIVIARRWCSSWALACLAALVLLANPFVQRYLMEAKQYMGDAAFTLAIFAATRWWLATGKRAAAVTWAVIAALGLTMSFVFWFAVAATGPMIFLLWLKRGDRRQVIRTVVAGVVCAAVGAVVYFGYAKLVGAGQSGMGFWQRFFILDRHASGELAHLTPLQRWWQFWADEFMHASWLPYSVPGGAVVIAGLVGFAVWVWREPVTGIAAVLTLTVTVAANLAGLWPLAIRTNLPTIVLFHMACVAIPLCIGGWLLDAMVLRKNVRDPGRSSEAQLAGGAPHHWLGLALTLVLAAGVIYKSRDLKHEPFDIRALLKVAAERSEANDLVIHDWATKVNQTIDPAPIRAVQKNIDWTNDNSLDGYIAAVREHQAGRVFVLSSIVNHERAARWAELGRKLADRGTFEKVWSASKQKGGAEVAIYMFTPR